MRIQNTLSPISAVRTSILFSVLLITTGCANVPMTVNLTPDTVVSSSDIGNGKTIYLTIRDERVDSNIGHRGSVGTQHGARITLEQDLSVVVQSALTEMLTTKGFDIRYDSDDGLHSELRVDIRGLSYSTSQGSRDGGVEVTAALKSTATGESETYENFYRTNSVYRVTFVPGEDSNNEWINAALNDVLHQLMRDRKLLEVLADG